jgi:hypothetical protein
MAVCAIGKHAQHARSISRKAAMSIRPASARKSDG